MAYQTITLPTPTPVQHNLYDNNIWVAISGNLGYQGQADALGISLWLEQPSTNAVAYQYSTDFVVNPPLLTVPVSYQVTAYPVPTGWSHLPLALGQGAVVVPGLADLHVFFFSTNFPKPQDGTYQTWLNSLLVEFVLPGAVNFLALTEGVSGTPTVSVH